MIAKNTEIDFNYISELNLANGVSQTTINYLKEEYERTKEIEHLKNENFIISDRSVLSTIIVAATKEVINLNNNIKNWDNLKKWFEDEINSNSIRIPSLVIYPKISVFLSINRQKNRKKYRSEDSIFLQSEFCEVSKFILDSISLNCYELGIEFLSFYNENISEEESTIKVMDFLNERNKNN